jgi:hypothetical protein
LSIAQWAYRLDASQVGVELSTFERFLRKLNGTF